MTDYRISGKLRAVSILAAMTGRVWAQSPVPPPTFAYSVGSQILFPNGGVFDVPANQIGGPTAGCVGPAPDTATLPENTTANFVNCTPGSSIFENPSLSGVDPPAGGPILGTVSGSFFVVASTQPGQSPPGLSTSVSQTFPSTNGAFSAASVFYHQEGLSGPALDTISLSFQVNSNMDNHGSFSYAEVYLYSDGNTGGNFLYFPVGLANQTLTVSDFQIGPSGMYDITIALEAVNNNGPGTESISLGFGCAVNAQLMGNGTTTVYGMAKSTYGMTLTQAAQSCGFTGFDWQQYITNLPCPSPIYPAAPGNVNLQSGTYCSSLGPNAQRRGCGNFRWR